MNLDLAVHKRILVAIKMRAFICIFLLFITLTSSAHHSSSIYDKNQSLNFTGEVVKFEWSNPHIFIHVRDTEEVSKKNGNPRIWQFETSNPSMMRSRGWHQNMLTGGEKVTIAGYPGRDEDRGIALLTYLATEKKIWLEDKGYFGQRLVSKADKLEKTTSIEGQWVMIPDRELLEILRPWNLHLTAKGQEAVDTFDDQTMLPQLRCTPNVAPSYMFIPDMKIITIQEDRVLFKSEYQGVERTFWLVEDLDAVPISIEGIESLNEPANLHGFAVATWQGKSLKVVTSNFAANRNGHQNGLTSGKQKKLVESFELMDPQTLAYHFELEDPEFFIGTVKGDALFAYAPTRTYNTDPCEIGNAQRLLKSHL
jgi:hypothetical protein